MNYSTLPNIFRERSSIIADLFFVLSTALSLLLSLTILRGILLIRNFDLTDPVPAKDLVRAFTIGVRFDLIMVAYSSIPLTLAFLLPKGLNYRRLFLVWMSIVACIRFFLGVLEVDFTMNSIPD